MAVEGRQGALEQAVGRLDHDTTGLLLLTDDGAFNHRMSSPKHHVPKRYLATTAQPVSSSLIDRVVAALSRPLMETPVGFKWFAPGLYDGTCVFGGEESAGASFLRRDGTAWSALTEAAFSAASLGNPVCFSEIMYNPPGGSAYEFIELLNVSRTQTLDLSGVKLEDGVTFDFNTLPPDQRLLAPGGRIVLVGNAAAFAAEHGAGLRGHTLLWHHPQWFPAWLKDYDFGPKPASRVEAMLAAVEAVDPLFFRDAEAALELSERL
mgnify:CR=1 FL=1